LRDLLIYFFNLKKSAAETHRLLVHGYYITDTKFMCLLVRYVFPNDKKIKTQLLELRGLSEKERERERERERRRERREKDIYNFLKLPQSCENLIRSVATYISGSAKRCAILGEFQDFFKVERNKILKLYNTRLKSNEMFTILKDTFFEQLSFLDPNVALFIESRDTFKDLSNIATQIRNIYSNAEVEQIFSIINNVKIKKRN
ncbi:hypothetical protein ALC56_07084, partial [Trachymyrmex septentrionalis]